MALMLAHGLNDRLPRMAFPRQPRKCAWPRPLSPVLLAALLVAALAAGCSGAGGELEGIAAFEHGYDDGFAQDSEYFLGYDDSWFTVGFEPILYQGGDIPFIDALTYDAGFFDGLFDAYNDGYFVAYRNAFIIGFSEGYDNAYWPDYLDFLASDQHIEYLNGGFSDGYNDGFSEGRVFGAFDFEAAFPFDWLDAFLDWESGTDLYFVEVDVGTGDLGPVIYYEWGADPHFLRSVERGADATRASAMGLRQPITKNHNPVLVRPLTDAQAADLDLTPTSTPRSNRALTLTESWLDRIGAYNVARASRSEPVRRRAMTTAP